MRWWRDRDPVPADVLLPGDYYHILVTAHVGRNFEFVQASATATTGLVTP